MRNRFLLSQKLVIRLYNRAALVRRNTVETVTTYRLFVGLFMGVIPILHKSILGAKMLKSASLW